MYLTLNSVYTRRFVHNFRTFHVSITNSLNSPYALKFFNIPPLPAKFTRLSPLLTLSHAFQLGCERCSMPWSKFSAASRYNHRPGYKLIRGWKRAVERKCGRVPWLFARLEHLERSKEQGEGLCVDAGSRVELMKINKKNCP